MGKQILRILQAIYLMLVVAIILSIDRSPYEIEYDVYFVITIAIAALASYFYMKSFRK